jgi:uncharacterized protein
MRRYLGFVIRYRILIILGTILISALLGAQTRHLKIIIDPNTILPQSHPYVRATAKVEKVFGSKYVAVVAITPKQGDALQAPVLEKISRITNELMKAPGFVKENTLSLTARRAKDIVGSADGLEVRPLMKRIPKNDKDIAALKQALDRNPVYRNTIISADRRTAAVYAEFKEGAGGFREVMSRINPVVERERDSSVDIQIGGAPVFLAPIEVFSERVVFLFPIAVLLIGLIHFEAFRTFQGLILPLITALVACAWGVGIMGWMGVPLDVFNAATPSLILAVAAGHAVQLLKRYYEEYDRIADERHLTPKQANEQAVIESIAKVGPVMIIAGGVAALGFFSLAVFDIISVRTFGIFTGVGIVSALIVELSFTPALRSLLPPPGRTDRKRERSFKIWDRITLSIALWAGGPKRELIYLTWGVLMCVAAAGTGRVVMDNSTKSYFPADIPFRIDDDKINQRLAGTNTLYVLIEGQQDDDIKDPAVLKAMDDTQRFIESQPDVGKTVSIADFLKRMNQAMNGDEASFYRVPESRELVSQYLLLYSMSGEPGDFDSYVDYGYRTANILAYLHIDSTAGIETLTRAVRAYAEPRFPKNVKVTMGGGIAQAAALNEVLIYNKILNIAQIAGVIFIITSIVFRSLWAGVLVLVPLLMAVVFNFGLMGWTGVLLNIPTSLCSAMAVGIGADYAIYLMYRLREELPNSIHEKFALLEVLRTAGKASLFVASAVVGGYAVLFFSFGFHVHQWLALLVCVAMAVSVFAALTLVPSLIMTFRPRFIFEHVSPERTESKTVPVSRKPDKREPVMKTKETQ